MTTPQEYIEHFRTLTTIPDNLKIEFLNLLGYTPISENLADNLEVRCNKCGQIFKRVFSTFMRNIFSCPKCELNVLTELNFTPYYENGAFIGAICSKGHTIKRQLNQFKLGNNKCPECEKESRFNEIKSALSSTNWNAVSYEKGKVKLICNICNNIVDTTYSDILKHNIVCEFCYNNWVKNCVENIGYEYVINKGSKVTIKCKTCGNEKTTTTVNLTRPNTTIFCKTCMDNERIEHIKNNYPDLEVVGISDDSKQITLKCKNNHIFTHFYSNIVRINACNCPHCENEQRKQKLEKLGYKVLTDNIKNNVTLMCSEGHTFTKRWRDPEISAYHFSCPICDNYMSSLEKDILKYLPKEKTCIGNWSILGNRELDFYLPEFNLAIEANGDYWHSEKFGRDEAYHQDKTDRCAEKGITLIHIWESEWYKNKDHFIKLINSYLK